MKDTTEKAKNMDLANTYGETNHAMKGNGKKI